MTDFQKDVGTVALYLFALALIVFGAYGLYRETAPRVTDVHAIILAVGLLLLPFFPARFAAAVKQVGGAVAEAWKAKKDAER